MDLTKFFLYTSLAVITYLMLLAWQEDYPPLVGGGVTCGLCASGQGFPAPEAAGGYSCDI